MFESLKIESKVRKEVRSNLYQNNKVGIDYYLLSGLSAVIATLGLLIDSPAVVIGGMLVSPLFYPAITLSMAAVRGNTKKFEQSIYNLLKAVLIIVAISFLVSYLVPTSSITNEIASRTEPNLLHLFIALFSGAAGAVAIIYPKVSTSLVGILVAAALVPPLGVAGFGIAQLDPQIIAGALLLFIANLLSIAFMGIVVFYIFGFVPKYNKDVKKIIRTDLIWSAVLLALIAIPLGYALTQSIQKEQRTVKIREVIASELDSKNLTGVVDVTITKIDNTTTVKATANRLEIPNQQQYENIKNQLEDYFEEEIELELVINPSYMLKY